MVYSPGATSNSVKDGDIDDGSLSDSSEKRTAISPYDPSFITLFLFLFLLLLLFCLRQRERRLTMSKRSSVYCVPCLDIRLPKSNDRRYRRYYSLILFYYIFTPWVVVPCRIPLARPNPQLYHSHTIWRWNVVTVSSLSPSLFTCSFFLFYPLLKKVSCQK